MIEHRPPQITLDNKAVYFISGKTYGGFFHLAGTERKETFKKILFEKAEKFLAKINIWVILSNHYHLLIEFAKGKDLLGFQKELHGTSSYLIKKLPAIEVLNEEQIILREVTPMEKRTEERINELWYRLKDIPVIAHFSARQKQSQTKVCYNKHEAQTKVCYNKHEAQTKVCYNSVNVIAHFSARQKEILEEFGFSLQTRQKIMENEARLKSAITTNNPELFKLTLSSCFTGIPFWSNYYSHIIRNELDFYRHFNYIVQNPIKHGLVKNL